MAAKASVESLRPDCRVLSHVTSTEACNCLTHWSSPVALRRTDVISVHECVLGLDRDNVYRIYLLLVVTWRHLSCEWLVKNCARG